MNKETLTLQLLEQRAIWLEGGEVASNLAMQAINSLLEQLFELLPVGEHDE